MSLSVKDLQKIEELLMKFFGKRLDNIEEDLGKVKTELYNLKDIVIGIRHELDTEHEFRYKRLEEIDGRVKTNTKEIKNIKVNLNLD